METLVQMTTTVGKREDAVKLAEDLLDKKLVACAQIDGPITSIYRWQGNKECEKEYQLTLKTSSHLEDELQQELLQTHPYEVAEILGMRIDNPSKPYLDWVLEQVKK